MPFHLVLIETSGNQNYIFATNKLRENVGASELTYRAGTQWVLEAVAEETGEPLWNEDAKTLRENLCDPNLNPSIEDEKATVEVITATSGKALLLVNSGEVGRKIIRCVTRRALKTAPGLDICGVISQAFDWKEDALGKVNREVHGKFEEVRANLPGPALRFLRLPIIDECQTSGTPASFLDKTRAGKPAPRSQVSDLKWQAKEPQADERLEMLLDQAPNPAIFGNKFAENVNWLEKNCEWLAVVHADGNGLGEVFLDFGRYAGCDDTKRNRDYVKMFRQFSIALDICTEKAFLFAAEQMAQRRDGDSFTFPILPIVLGGDDLTVVCDGRHALRFTHDFLTEFEKQTGESHDLVGDIIPRIAGAAFTPKRLSASAGVAIIKPHFPFSAAYDLAEELIASAKRVKKIVKDHDPDKLLWPCSTLDFHALYDASSSELSEIRHKLRKDDDATKLYGRPYVVTPKEKLAEGAMTPTGRDWAEQHHWSKLECRVNAILQPDEEKQRRVLPNSQLHDLRAALFLGQQTADAGYNLIRHRYEKDGVTKLEEKAGSLFAEDKMPDDDGKPRCFTGLLDAMDAADFWRKSDAE